MARTSKYEDPKAITGEAGHPTAMVQEYRRALGSGYTLDSARELLIVKGYAKAAAELKYARAAAKPAKKPAKKSAKKSAKKAIRKSAKKNAQPARVTVTAISGGTPADKKSITAA